MSSLNDGNVTYVDWTSSLAPYVPQWTPFLPLMVLLVTNVFFAIVGYNVGFTRLYLNTLLAVFEWGRVKIKTFEKSKDGNSDQVDDVDEDDVDRRAKPSREQFIANQRSIDEMNHGFQLDDAVYFFRKGMQVIVEDTVTQRFDAAELSSWNLLTRTNTHYEFISWRLTFLWLIGCVVRLLILFPFRATLFVISMLMIITGSLVIGCLPDGSLKRQCNYRWTMVSFRVLMRSFLAVITFHDRHNRTDGGGICVANHTSPIDVSVLGCDNCYAMVGQTQGGFMGFLQNVTSRSQQHIWFQRSETRDRMAVVRRLREHVDDPRNRSILIFPEGTCVNNTSIMMFKKGSFELGRKIYPVAIKYDTRFADAFWNSSKQNLLRHFLNILTSWSLVADVWYLPPETQMEGETAIEFTNRVKHIIANKGGLVELEWDGQLKREKPKPSFLMEQQEAYSKRIINFDSELNHGTTGNGTKLD